MTFHSRASLGARHPVHNWEYANQAAREAATGFDSWDLFKIALQTDDDSLWMLTATTPTWVSVGAEAVGANQEAELLTYTDTSNKVIGPLSESPSILSRVTLFVMKGIIQEYTQDYTVREVTGGSAPGFYVCISPTSTAPGGGSFSGGSNPGTGIEFVLASGEKVQATYPY